MIDRDQTIIIFRLFFFQPVVELECSKIDEYSYGPNYPNVSIIKKVSTSLKDQNDN